MERERIWKIATIVCAVALFMALLGPVIENEIDKKNQENYQKGMTDCLLITVDSISKNGYVQIELGNDESLVLVPYTE